MDRNISDVCGGSKAAGLSRLQDAVRPQFRRPLRWGLKNPHATYYLDALRIIFPCLVYVNTVRDLDIMVANRDHFSGRVHEAERFGFLTEAESERIATSGERSVLAERFYGAWLTRVNLGLDAWLRRCLPERSVHVPLQRMVAIAPHAPGCLVAIARPLAHALRMRESDVLNATRAFAVASLPLVRESVTDARKQQPPPNPHAWRWPPSSSLEPDECRGALVFP